MHGIYELKEMLCKELEEYGTKSEVSPGMLEIVDKLAHTIKNLDKIIEYYEEDRSSYDGGRYMERGNYARGRGARREGRNRYANDGYSRAADVAEKLHELMRDVHDEKTRYEMQRLAEKMEQM